MGSSPNEDINRIGIVHQYAGVVSVSILGPLDHLKCLAWKERSKQYSELVFKKGIFIILFNFISSSTFYVVIKKEVVPHLNLIILLLFFKELEFMFIFPVLLF